MSADKLPPGLQAAVLAALKRCERAGARSIEFGFHPDPSGKDLPLGLTEWWAKAEVARGDYVFGEGFGLNGAVTAITEAARQVEKRTAARMAAALAKKATKARRHADPHDVRLNLTGGYQLPAAARGLAHHVETHEGTTRYRFTPDAAERAAQLLQELSR